MSKQMYMKHTHYTNVHEAQHYPHPHEAHTTHMYMKHTHYTHAHEAYNIYSV